MILAFSDLFLIYKSPQWFLPSFKSIGLSVLEKKQKIDFQDGRHGGHLGFPIRTISAIFDLSVTPIEFPIGKTSAIFDLYKSPRCFLPIGLLVQEKKRKIYFQDGSHGGHLGFQIGMILVILDLQVTPMLPTEFRLNWPFDSGKEAKNRFSRWPPWRPSWISNRNDFGYF